MNVKSIIMMEVGWNKRRLDEVASNYLIIVNNRHGNSLLLDSSFPTIQELDEF